MKTLRTQTLCASFVIAFLFLLSSSPAQAGGDKGKFRGRLHVTFTKWVADFPNMAGSPVPSGRTT